jgi:tetratricopeptide (TPR) repeat protein
MVYPQVFLLSSFHVAKAIICHFVNASLRWKTMRRLILLLLFTVCFQSLADEITAKENWFDQGLKAYQTKNWDQARDNFEKALQFQPNEAAIMYNLGLAYFQLNKKGYAVGYWRKALALMPSLTGAREALDKIQERYHFTLLEKSPWALTAHETFSRFGWNFWLSFLAVFTSLSGWLWLSFWQKRKTAIANESDDQSSVSLGLVALTVLFVAAASLCGGKWWDDQKVRGTVVNAAAELKSAPTTDGVTLSPLPEASEVQILGSHEDWFQVTAAGGTEGTSGWVKKSDVLAASKDF